MPKLPGSYNGSPHPDLRLIHLSVPQIMYYAKRGEWDKIIKVNSGQVTNSVWFPSGVKHSWARTGSGTYTVTVSHATTNTKIRSYIIALLVVPAAYRTKYGNMSHNQIYALVQELEISRNQEATECQKKG